MGTLFVKVFKWLVSATFFILGVLFLQMSTDYNTVRPTFLFLMCFGVVFWLSKSTYEAGKKVFVISTLVVIGASALAKFIAVPVLGTILGLDWGFYTWWWICTMLGGLLIMSRVLKDT